MNSDWYNMVELYSVC